VSTISQKRTSRLTGLTPCFIDWHKYASVTNLLDQYSLSRTMHDTVEQLRIADVLVEAVIPELLEKAKQFDQIVNEDEKHV